MHNIVFSICLIIVTLRHKLELDLQGDIPGSEFVLEQTTKQTGGLVLDYNYNKSTDVSNYSLHVCVFLKRH